MALSLEEGRARDRERGARWRARNRERHRAAVRAWRVANPEKYKAIRARRKHDPERERACYLRRRERTAPERETALAVRKAEREARRAATAGQRRESRRAREKAWREAHPERRRELMRRWKLANPDKVRARKLRRRREIVAELARAQRGRCAYCRRKLSTDTTHVDHILPRAKGGRNHQKNLQLTCADCNIQKRDLLPEDFARRQGMLL